jgi:tricorn protease-like protein
MCGGKRGRVIALHDFSPDGRWLAYRLAKDDEDLVGEVHVIRIEDGADKKIEIPRVKGEDD